MADARDFPHDDTITRSIKDLLADKARDKYRGEERKEAPDKGSDMLKWLPLIVVTIGAAGGYGALQTQVSQLEKDVEALTVVANASRSLTVKVETLKENIQELRVSDREQWRAIRTRQTLPRP